MGLNKFSLVALILMCSAFSLFAALIFPMPEVIKPFRVNVDGRHIYIGDGPNIHVYSITDGRLLTRFGKAGEGPREFRLFPEFSPELDIQPEGILVSSLGKISFFTKAGEFQWEKKSPGYVLEHFNRLLSEHIVGQRVERDNNEFNLVLNLYDKDFSEKTEFHRHGYYLKRGKYNPIQRGIYISNFFIFDSLIYVGGAIDSGTIHVYDRQGKKVREIKPPLDPVPFTKKDRQGWIDSYISNDEYKQLYERRKKWFNYPDFFPLFQNFIVADNRIYIQTYKRNEQKGANELVILDLNGKLMKKTWVPLVEFFDFTPNPYTIGGNRLYQVVENLETEAWELLVFPVECNSPLMQKRDMP